MKKDIEIPISKDVFIAIAKEWNKEFNDKVWNAYLINNRTTPIETIFVVSRGYYKEKTTSTMRHSFNNLAAKSFLKVEILQEDILALDNEFYLTFYAENKLFENKFVFKKDTINEKNTSMLPVMNVEGVLVQE